jgi:hypothetical protein
MHGSSNRTPGNRGRVGDKIQDGGLKWFEAQADHERSSDGHGRAEARCTFEKGAESESHKEYLQPTVWCNSRYGMLHNLELAGVDGNVVKEHRSNHDPYNFQQTESAAVKEAGNRKASGHAKYQNGADDRGGGSANGAEMRAHFESGQERQQHHYWKRGKKSR